MSYFNYCNERMAARLTVSTPENNSEFKGHYHSHRDPNHLCSNLTSIWTEKKSTNPIRIFFCFLRYILRRKVVDLGFVEKFNKMILLALILALNDRGNAG